jgi:predicted nucleic acid-binding Zn finger protein
LTGTTNSSLENNDSFEKILDSIGKKRALSIDIIDRLSKVFSIQQMTKVKEIISEIVKVVFKPSNRIVWMKLGTDKDYVIYPRVYCSCMDFFLQGIVKNRKYYCKHLIAQGIAEQLSKNNLSDIEMIERDENFKEKVTRQLELEHFLS